MKHKDMVRAIWNMRNGITMGEWVDCIADEFMVLHRLIATLQRELAKAKRGQELPKKGER